MICHKTSISFILFSFEKDLKSKLKPKNKKISKKIEKPIDPNSPFAVLEKLL